MRTLGMGSNTFLGDNMIHTDEDDEFARIEREAELRKGQPYHFTKRKDDDDDILPKDEREQKVKKIKKEIRRNKFTESDLEELETLIKLKLNKDA